MNEAGYEKYKGTDHFILATEQLDRKSMPDSLSRGFAHFYKQIEPNGNLTFRSLRKTYITGLAIYTGGNAASITQHGDNDVLERHYIDKNAIAKAAKNFEPFSAELVRKGQLEKVRHNSQTLNKENERG
ncbi:MAG: hypothetical protein IPN13_17770 [Bacteroidetes bacterium]|nr:hypothetical protein [Bacteroidota bacterium]